MPKKTLLYSHPHSIFTSNDLIAIFFLPFKGKKREQTKDTYKHQENIDPKHDGRNKTKKKARLITKRKS